MGVIRPGGVVGGGDQRPARAVLQSRHPRVRGVVAQHLQYSNVMYSTVHYNTQTQHRVLEVGGLLEQRDLLGGAAQLQTPGRPAPAPAALLVNPGQHALKSEEVGVLKCEDKCKCEDNHAQYLLQQGQI